MSEAYSQVVTLNLGSGRFLGAGPTLVMLTEPSATLPEAALGAVITYKDANRNAASVPKTIAGQIDGATSYAINVDNGAVTLERINSGWTVIADSGPPYPTARVANPLLFASLPASPPTGTLADVSDSNTIVWGDAIGGGGTDQVLGRWNGTVWTVVGV